MTSVDDHLKETFLSMDRLHYVCVDIKKEEARVGGLLHSFKGNKSKRDCLVAALILRKQLTATLRQALGHANHARSVIEAALLARAEVNKAAPPPNDSDLADGAAGGTSEFCGGLVRHVLALQLARDKTDALERHWVAQSKKLHGDDESAKAVGGIAWDCGVALLCTRATQLGAKQNDPGAKNPSDDESSSDDDDDDDDDDDERRLVIDGEAFAPTLWRLHMEAMETTAAREIRAGDKADKLLAIIHTLRQAERDLDLQADLLIAQRRFSVSIEKDRNDDSRAENATGYSEGNFAYGSTPLQSVVKLFEVAEIAEALVRQGAELCVFGSSLGWLVLFGHVICNCFAIGYELLPCLVERSVRAREVCGIDSDAAKFVTGDMLDAPVGSTRVLILTSQCWDKHLIDLVHKKLANELQPETLVIDYTSLLCNGGVVASCFDLVANVTVDVSWNPGHTMTVCRRNHTTVAN